MERVDLVDRDTAAEAVEILVDNFAPFVVQLEARQGDLKVYEAAWTQTGAAGTLAPAAQDARNPKWVNKKGDIRFVASLSEPIRTDANRPRLLIKDKDDNIQTVAMDPVPDSKQMKWTCAIAEADLQDHRYDDEPRQLAFVGQDLGAQRVGCQSLNRGCQKSRRDLDRLRQRARRQLEQFGGRPPAQNQDRHQTRPEGGNQSPLTRNSGARPELSPSTFCTSTYEFSTTSQ